MGKFVVKYLLQSEYGDWDAFVESAEYGSIFHKSTWINALNNDSEAIKSNIIGCFNTDNNLVGGAIISWEKLFWMLKVSTIPSSTPFFGIVIIDRNSDYISKLESHRFAILEALLEFIEKEYHVVTMILPPEFKDIRLFNWRNYDVKVMFTYRDRLQAPSEMKIMPDIRRRVKKAEKLDYNIYTNKNDEHLNSVFGLISKSYERQAHHFRFTRSQFNNFVKNEAITDQVKVYSIWQSEVPVAAIIIITDSKKAYYWLAGGDSNLFDTGLNQLLLWKVIDDLSNSNIELLDLVGANTPTISKYKSGYNFNLEPYYLVHKNTHVLTKLVFSMKELVGIFSRN